MNEVELHRVFGTQYGKPAVSPIEAILLTLWVLANEESFRGVADRFGFSRGHAHSIVIKTVKHICKHKRNYIRWPEGAEFHRNVEDFSQLRDQSFPNVVGVVDGTHIPIPAPTNDDSFYNRKGYHSMQLQVTVYTVS